MVNNVFASDIFSFGSNLTTNSSFPLISSLVNKQFTVIYPRLFSGDNFFKVKEISKYPLYPLPVFYNLYIIYTI